MEDIVSEFILGTCRMLPKFNTNVFDSIRSAYDRKSVWRYSPSKAYFIVCGSCAEFFIQPIQQCFGDIDFLETRIYLLAFIDKTPVLPYDLRHTAEPIDCLLMEPYLDYPGFVRLRYIGEICYNWDNKAFEFIRSNVQVIVETPHVVDENKDNNNKAWLNVGPAKRCKLFANPSITCDNVKAIWCPQWPNEAKHWPFRRRKYGWPKTAIVHEVVQNGCHVVNAKHPACRTDMCQHRLSFSIAEVILLQSWTKRQQIVYHMLRFFAKRELINSNSPKKDEVLCTYHLKTLMLWSCEEMSPEWWNSSSVIELCSNLLKKLANWLKDTRCPNYFIYETNLFHENFNPNIVEDTVKRLVYYCDSSILSIWFVEHYMQPNFFDISRYNAKWTHDVLSCGYLIQTHDVMKSIRPKFFDLYFSMRFCFDVMIEIRGIAEDIDDKSMEILFYEILIYSIRISSPDEGNDFFPAAEYEACYWFFGSMLRILHAVPLSQLNDADFRDIDQFLALLEEILEKNKFLRSKHHNLPNECVDGSELLFLKAQVLMENLTGSNDDLEFQIMCKISYFLLTAALEFDDYKTNTLVNATFSYRAALHFAVSEYQIAIDLASTVIMNDYCEKKGVETLNAGCLLYIEDVSIIIGFYLFYLNIKNNLHYTKRPIFLDLRLTPEVFAHYLRISSIERAIGAFGPNDVLQTPIFPLDAILMTITTRKWSRMLIVRRNILCVYQRTYPMSTLAVHQRIHVCSPDGNSLSPLLMEYSLQYMTYFYQAINKEFGIDCGTVDCYRAAYLYKCQKYPEVLHLCERILNKPDLRNSLRELAFANIMVFPPLDLFFDTDVHCLLGVHTLAYCLLISYLDLVENECFEISTLHKDFVRKVQSCKFSLSSVLVLSDSVQSQYYIGRHFLARYLKIRCLLDCTNSLSEVMIDLKKVKASLPFEHIIRCFLQQKLRRFQ